MSFLKSAGVLFVVVFLSVLVVGCAFEAEMTVRDEVQVPAEVSPDGGTPAFTKIRSLSTSFRGCTGSGCANEPDPDPDDVIQYVRDMSVVFAQTNTESNVIGGVVRLRGNGQERLFDVVRVGGQLRFASPESVGLWIYDNQIHRSQLNIEFWFSTVGFESELVTASLRHAGRSIAATSFFVEIDCGNGDPFSTPDQACVIAP